MPVRIAKAALVAMTGVFLLLVGVDNLIDFGTNFAFVQHVMSMDTVDSRLSWRAIADPFLHHAAYSLIISAQIAVGVLCLVGAIRLWQRRNHTAERFNQAKALAVGGLALAFSLWFFGFMVVGGEWFQMWRSPTWNGQQAAFRFIGCVGLVLIFLNQHDEDGV